ncbi:hypothetical protein F511_39951 [Dorcoceras hygrometricum]|uniref:Uncharacterized protein n=1 Tax=Dorcoceras hygrometricum TaxID=472368 RepID=A0A2Z7AV40_9LAMI|nr:hypothetical protein F511_39951 [Dorcoceras hygrometricum]
MGIKKQVRFVSELNTEELLFQMSKGGVIRLLRVSATLVAAVLGGSFAIGFLTSSVSEQTTLRRKHIRSNRSGFAFQAILPYTFAFLQKKYGSPCGSCKGVGFYRCKLCKTNGTIKWSPLYDPLVINPCLCPTCDGSKVQRCLNCLGGGIQG